MLPVRKTYEILFRAGCTCDTFAKKALFLSIHKHERNHGRRRTENLGGGCKILAQMSKEIGEAIQNIFQENLTIGPSPWKPGRIPY